MESPEYKKKKIWVLRAKIQIDLWHISQKSLDFRAENDNASLLQIKNFFSFTRSLCLKITE